MVLVVALAVLMLHVLVNLALVVVAFGGERVVSSFIRLLLTALLAMGTYRGVVAARWILSVLLLLGGGMAVWFSLPRATTNIWALQTLFQGLVFLAVSVCFLFVPQVREFLRYQARQRSGSWPGPR